MQSKRTYLVTGATGHVGNLVARGLLKAGHTVRVFGRDRERLKPLADLGAEPYVGNMLDAASVLEAFQSMEAALLIGQGDRTAHDYRAQFALAGSNYAAAARATGLKHAVFVSSLGAHDDRNRGMVLIHSDIERVLNGVQGLNVLHLRAPVFYEDLFYYLDSMQRASVLTWPIATDAPLDMGSTRDIAEVALRHLLRLDFSGSTALELHGPQLVTLRQIVTLISDTLGRPFTAQPLSREQDIEGMVAAGFGRDFATLMNDAWDTFSRRVVQGEATGPISRLPTTIQDFVQAELAPALHR